MDAGQSPPDKVLRVILAIMTAAPISNALALTLLEVNATHRVVGIDGAMLMMAGRMHMIVRNPIRLVVMGVFPIMLMMAAMMRHSMATVTLVTQMRR
jgi:hypothetical protein